jgi:hypothetical protein
MTRCSSYHTWFVFGMIEVMFLLFSKASSVKQGNVCKQIASIITFTSPDITVLCACRAQKLTTTIYNILDVMLTQFLTFLTTCFPDIHVNVLSTTWSFMQTFSKNWHEKPRINLLFLNGAICPAHHQFRNFTAQTAIPACFIITMPPKNCDY